MNEYIVTKENFAKALNLGMISKNGFNSIKNELNNYSKEITEMIIRQQEDRETAKNLQTTKEVIGIGTDIGKSFINATVNEGIAESISSNYSYNYSSSEQALENKERVGKFFEGINQSENTQKEEYNSSGDQLEKRIRAIVIENEQFLREKNVFSDEEFNKILKSGVDGVPHMFDYSLGTGGTSKDMLNDIKILDKCCSCTYRKIDGTYIFKDFLILDGGGEAVNPKLINNITMPFILNFGLQSGVAEHNEQAIKNIKMVTNVRSQAGKLSKLRNDSNLLKLLQRTTGAEAMKEEFREYSEQLKPIKLIAKTEGRIEQAIKIGYQGAKYASLHSMENKYKRVKNIAFKSILDPNRDHLSSVSANASKDSTKLALKLYKEKKLKKESFEKIEEVVGTVRHPARKSFSILANKFKNSAFAKKIAERAKKTTLAKVYKSLNNLLANSFKVVGRVVTPIALIIRKVIITSFIILAPIILFLIFFIISGLSASSSSNVSSLITIMPLANQSDFDAYQSKYDELDDNFLNSLEGYLANYATQLNLKDEKIKYGVNGQNNEEEMVNDDFKNGMYYRFITDEKNEGKSSNIEDVISIMAIMMSQSQADHRDVAINVLEWLYDISHSYTIVESPLYACDSACHKIEYKCTDKYHDYSDSDLRYNPFHALKKDGGEYEIIEPTEYCPVCSKISNITSKLSDRDNCYDSYINSIIEDDNKINEEDYMWCTENATSVSTCYHGHFQASADDEHYLGSGRPSLSTCNNPVEREYEIELSSGETITRTYYACGGHSHKACAGHNYKCCLGHTDIQMNVEIKFYDELKDIINKYDFGLNDVLFKEISSKGD